MPHGHGQRAVGARPDHQRLVGQPGRMRADRDHLLPPVPPGDHRRGVRRTRHPVVLTPQQHVRLPRPVVGARAREPRPENLVGRARMLGQHGAAETAHEPRQRRGREGRHPVGAVRGGRVQDGRRRDLRGRVVVQRHPPLAPGRPVPQGVARELPPGGDGVAQRIPHLEIEPDQCLVDLRSPHGRKVQHRAASRIGIRVGMSGIRIASPGGSVRDVAAG